MTNPPNMSELIEVPEFWNDAERNRWLAGRHDWRASDWRDHCGDPECEYCWSDCLPDGDKRLALARAEALIEALKARSSQ